MPRFVIERSLVGAGILSTDELHEISAKSNSVLAGMAPRAQWVQSFVTDDKIYCVYLADKAGTVREHARCGGFPADSVAIVRAVIDPTIGEEF
jgi:Nickel responsive protein SCO4226-like